MGSFWGDDADVGQPHRERTLIPVGTHRATVDEVERTTSKAGNPMLVIRFNVFDKQGEALGSLRSWEVLTLGFRVEALRRALMRPGDPKFDLGGPEDASDGFWARLVGRACQLKVKHEPNEAGEVWEKVDRLLPPLPGDKDDAPEARHADDDATEGAAPSIADDDLPF